MVQCALQWLKLNNLVYGDIVICNARLKQLPEDGELTDIHTVELSNKAYQNRYKGQAQDRTDPGLISEDATNSGVLLPGPKANIQKKIQNVVDDVTGNSSEVTINKRGIPTIPWPTRDDCPVSEFTTTYFFTMSFPCLFPHGKGDFFMNRIRTCPSLADWAQHLLWYKDGRFARHEYFKFIVHNMIMRKRTLENSSFVVRQKLGDKHLTVSELKDRLESGDMTIAHKILYFGASLRGTSQYWSQRSKELRCLIQFKVNEGKGLPSFFSTGSCAEFYLQPLRRLLQLYIKKNNGPECQF